MGADFVYQLLPLSKWSKDREIELTMKIWEADESNILIQEGSGYTEFVDDEELEDEKNHMIDCLKQYWDDLPWRRDVAPIRIKDFEGFITGGLSWGDSPTDSYRTMERLQGLFEDFQDYAKQDRDRELLTRRRKHG